MSDIAKLINEGGKELVTSGVSCTLDITLLFRVPVLAGVWD
jgi:hypothetical protein